MGSTSYQDDERVLVVAPTARDARLSQTLFAQAGLACAICQNLATLGAELARGAGVLLLTEEALAQERYHFLTAALAAEPTWSSLPIIMLASADPRQLLSTPLVQQLGNVLVLERPISTHTLLSVVQMALRTRRRQYQARLVAEVSRLLTASLADSETLAAVTALLVPRLADCGLLYTLEDGRPRLAAMAFAAGAQSAETRLRTMLTHTTQGGAPSRAADAGSEAPPASRDAEEGAGADLAETHLQIVGATARLVVPLEVQGCSLGALSLGMQTSGRTFLTDERQVVQEVAGRVALALNQSHLYRAEQVARAEAEAAVRSRDELMALISHDLKNPLSVALGQAQLLQRQLARGDLAPEQVQRGIASIVRAAGQMQAQIAELLDIARLRAGQPLEVRREATDLVDLTHTVAAAVQHGTEQHQISVQTQLATLVALVDHVRIERVLDNLLSNAVKYSPAGGPITVNIDVERADAEAWAVVQVRDQGIGIPAGDLPHVFERFKRGSNVTPAMRGTGLGLASVGQIVEQHGGQIAIVSSVNEGTVVTIRLPLRGDAG